MNKKRIAILGATVISALILTGVYVSSINNIKNSTSFETLKGSIDSLGDTKLAIRGYGGIFTGKEINLSKDGETSNIPSLNSNINYGNAFSKEFINENKDFFKAEPLSRVVIDKDHLVAVDFGGKWENGDFKTELKVKIKKAKGKTELFTIALPELINNYSNQILDIVIDGENILVFSNMDTNSADKGVLLKINLKDKSYKIISDDFFNALSEDIKCDEVQELMLTEKNVYFQAEDKKGNPIIIKKDFTSDKDFEIIHENKMTIISNTINYDLNKKQICNIVIDKNDKLNLIFIDGKTEEVQVYEDLKSEKFKIIKPVVGTNYNSEYINESIVSGNNLIISYGIPVGVSEDARTYYEQFIEVIDLNTKQSIYLGKYSDRTSIFKYIN